jgi:LPS export ABC transporter protein LptC
VVQWDLLGEIATGFEGDPLLHLTGVHMVFYRDGAVEAVLDSETGEIDEKTNNTTAYGNVVVVTQDGRTLKSQVLHWDNARELIHTDKYVEFTDGDQVLTGYGLETDPNLTNLTLRQHITGHAPSQDATEDGKK